ncbi:MAG: DoxX family protein [Alistipes sp.]|jgi:putative oxidoreductase|nr:DoxX family protein [Alistipes sp.]
MIKKLLDLMNEYRSIDRAVLFLRLFVGVLISLHIINKLQTYNFVLTGYPALLFESSWATFVIFTLLEAIFAFMIVAGYGTRFAAFIMALGMFIEIFIIYSSLGWLGVERQILYIGIYTTLVMAGSGRYGLEAHLDRRHKALKSAKNGNK